MLSPQWTDFFVGAAEGCVSRDLGRHAAQAFWETSDKERR